MHELISFQYFPDVRLYLVGTGELCMWLLVPLEELRAAAVLRVASELPFGGTAEYGGGGEDGREDLILDIATISAASGPL